jgi:hypothetical protein
MSTPGTPRISAAPYSASKGVIGTLFDLSFTSYLAPKIIKFLYGACIAIDGLITLIAIIAAFGVKSILGVLVMLVSPVVFLFLVGYCRILLELAQVFFSIEENGRATVAQLRSRTLL